MQFSNYIWNRSAHPIPTTTQFMKTRMKKKTFELQTNRMREKKTHFEQDSKFVSRAQNHIEILFFLYAELQVFYVVVFVYAHVYVGVVVGFFFVRLLSQFVPIHRL